MSLSAIRAADVRWYSGDTVKALLTSTLRSGKGAAKQGSFAVNEMQRGPWRETCLRTVHALQVSGMLAEREQVRPAELLRFVTENQRLYAGGAGDMWEK